MKYIFINLKRFEVPRQEGGLSPFSDPVQWIRDVMTESCALGIGQLNDLTLAYLLPESLVRPAKMVISDSCQNDPEQIAVGCQGVHWEDITANGNFGAFTSLLPAKSAKAIGCDWAIIGHSEERKAKLDLLRMFAEKMSGVDKNLAALDTVNAVIGREVSCALDVGMNVLLCIGETSEERGGGTFEEQKARIRSVLENQILAGFSAVKDQLLTQSKVVLGYEPVWAIGPGKNPPGKDYIQFVAETVKSITLENYGVPFPVVYGGGLKKENAAMLASIPSIDGGLVALTKFSGEIGFTVKGLKEIIDLYTA